MTTNGIVNGPVLLDGFVAGTWKVQLTRRTARVTLLPYRRWRDDERHDVETAARRMVALALPEGDPQVSVALAADAPD